MIGMQDSEIDQEVAPLIEQPENKKNSTTIDEAFEKSGGVGKFQALVWISMALFLTSGEVFNSMVVYYNKVPDLICTTSTGERMSCS